MIEITHNGKQYRIYRNSDGRLCIDRGECREGGIFGEELVFRAIDELFEREF